MGFLPVLKAFIAVVLGGLGSLSGAVAGGFALAFIEISLRVYLPDAWLAFRESLTLALVIVLLPARPQGLPGRRGAARWLHPVRRKRWESSGNFPTMPSFARGVRFAPGEVPEWPNGADSKSVEGASLPGVRIPPSPPFFQ